MAVTPPVPPNSINVSVSGTEDQASITVPFTGTDVDGTVTEFRVVITLPQHGVLKDGNGNVLKIGDTVPATGNAANVYFVPDANWNGQTTFQYAARDNAGLQDPTPATVTINVTPVNDPPETSNTSASGAEDAAGIAVTLTGSDIDGTVASFTIKDLPANGVLKYNGVTLNVGDSVPASGNSATVTFVPNANWNGETTFNYASKDNEGLSDATPAKATITVTPVNDPPETVDVSASGAEDTPVNIVLKGSDVDGTVSSFTIKDLPANGVLKYNGATLNVGDSVPATGNSATVVFVPNANWNGETSFNYASKDNDGLSDATPAKATVTVTPVNDPPETVNTSGSGAEDTDVSLTLSGSDSDGTVQGFVIKTLPDNGVLKLNGVALNVGDVVPATAGAATVTFTPGADWNGTTTFNYASKDNDGLEDPTPATGTITVTPVADPPETIDTASTGQEDTPVAVSLMGSDADGTVASFTISTLPSNGVLKDGNGNVLKVGDSVAAVNGAATVYFHPTAQWSGETAFDYASKDNENLVDATPATATITVEAVNDPPETDNTSATGAEDSSSIAVNLSGSDTDGAVTSFTITSLPTNGVLKDADGNVLKIGDTVAASGGGATVFFTPNANWNGDTGFNYASKDDEGLSDPTPALATIKVTPVNDAPETNNTSATGNEDQPVAVSLSGTDPDGTVQSFTITSLPENGVLKDGNGNVLKIGDTVLATGNGATVYFTPNADWNGETNFNYASKDNEGLSDETPATANIKVNPVNDAPETDNTSATGQEDSAINIVLSGSDPDGTVTSFTIKDLPANGVLKDGNGNVLKVGDTVTAVDGEATVTFTPNANWNGDTSFHYASKDNEGLEDPTPAKADISVTPVNDAPETASITANGQEDGPPIAVALSGSDIDGVVKVFTINSLPNNGVLKDANGNVLKVGDTVVASGNGATVFFTPNANWNGTTEFDYASRDNENLDDLTPGTATINVASVNDAPDTADSVAKGTKGATDLPLTLTGSDSDGTVTSFVIKGLPANGTLKDANGNVLKVGDTVTANANGEAQVFFTPTSTFTGAVTFKYASKDNEGLEDSTPATGTVTITAPPSAPDPKPPETINTSATGNEDQVKIEIKLSGTDSDGTVKSFTINDLPANGKLYDANGNVLKAGDVVAATANGATVYFTPTANWNGTTTFHYASGDNDNLNDATPATATIKINSVNDGPDTCDVSIKANDCADKFKVVLAGTDVDGKVVSFKITDLPTDGVLKDANGKTITKDTVITASNNQAYVYFYPTSNWDGSTTFKYAAVDNSGAQDTTPATATIKTDHGNEGPTTADVTVSGKEDGGPVTLKLTGADTDGTVTAFKINALAPNGVLKNSSGRVLKVGDTVTATNGTATVTFTPNADWSGSTTFKYSAKDNDGAYDSTPATGTIKIIGDNDAPVTKDVTASGCEDGGKISVCLAGTDADGKVVSFTITDLPANGVLTDASGKVLKVGDVVTASNNGATVYFTPNAEWSGSTSFKYAAKDDSGAVDATPGTAKVVVSEVNDAPTTNAVTATGAEDGGPVKVVLSGADIDGTVTGFKISTIPANGVFKDAAGNVLSAGSVIAASGGQATVYFTPKADFSGDVTFQYAAKDNAGLYDASPANGKISITAVNDAPKAVADTASVTAGQSVKLTSLLSNDTDPDGDKLTITSVQGATKGSALLNSDGTVTFTATAGQSGAGGFTYTVSDGHGGTATATVSVDIKAAASAPAGPSGPGVHTAAWWQSTGAVYWDGATDPAGTKHSPTDAGYPKAELTYSVDTNANGTVDSKDYLLIGDFNKNGVTDNGEHTLLISRADAKALLSSTDSDARAVLGKELVATWLNYLSENPVGTTANGAAPAWFVQEAVDWLSQLSGTTKTLANGVTNSGAVSSGHFVGADVSQYGASWNTGINLDGQSGIQYSGKDVMAGDDIHDALAQYNGVGKIGSTIWAVDA